MIQFKLNDTSVEVNVPGDMPLLWVLRDELKRTGTKFGCGKGLCGACTVHLDGQAIRACVTPVAFIAGKSVTTIEGLASSIKTADGLHPLQRAWLDHQVPQCGYCQCGQIMSAAALLNEDPNPTDEKIENFMAGNICRCGTYPRIRKAIKSLATAEGIKK